MSPGTSRQLKKVKLIFDNIVHLRAVTIAAPWREVCIGGAEDCLKGPARHRLDQTLDGAMVAVGVWRIEEKAPGQYLGVPRSFIVNQMNHGGGTGG